MHLPSLLQTESTILSRFCKAPDNITKAPDKITKYTVYLAQSSCEFSGIQSLCVFKNSIKCTYYETFALTADGVKHPRRSSLLTMLYKLPQLQLGLH